MKQAFLTALVCSTVFALGVPLKIKELRGGISRALMRSLPLLTKKNLTTKQLISGRQKNNRELPNSWSRGRENPSKTAKKSIGKFVFGTSKISLATGVALRPLLLENKRSL